jgi:4-alpha-glucanotransferase
VPTTADIAFQAAESYVDALDLASEEWGIEREFWDIFGKKHIAPSAIEEKILMALGVSASSLGKLERERLQRFEQQANRLAPSVHVSPQPEAYLPVSIEAGAAIASAQITIELEDGGKVAATWTREQIGVLRQIASGERRWTVYRIPLPPETGMGYHVAHVAVNLADGVVRNAESRLIVTPEQAYLPEHLAVSATGKTAGISISLYGLRSGRNWGCGDLTDLRAVVDWAAEDLEASLIGLNPLHALHNRFPYNTSPYLPLSLYYKNLIYIDVEHVPEMRSSRTAKGLLDCSGVQAELAALRQSEYVNYEGVDRIKKRFLKCLYREFERSAEPSRRKEFEEFRIREGMLLERFALYCALDETLHKQDRSRWTWRDWPAEYQDPKSPKCQRFSVEHRRLIRYYEYIQFVLEEQLSEVHRYARQKLGIGLYHDLALATDRSGADLWAHRDYYVEGCRVGSPPDAFAPKGQDWAFPPPNADAHRENGYQLFRESIRKVARFGGALRIDHVMRLFHLFWIPDGVAAKDGVYVRDHAEDLLHVLALESVRQENIVVGEDLGTVTDEIRETLKKFRVLSYRVFYFEKNRDGTFKRTQDYPTQALVASTTHDLPTIAGFWTGRDVEARLAAHLIDAAGYERQMRERRQERQLMLDALQTEGLLPADYTRDATLIPELDGTLHNAIIGYLAQTPSMLLLLNQEDLTKETEQQNLPGSTSEYPNWQRKMKWSVEDLRTQQRARDFSQMFRHQLVRTGRARI